MSYSKADEQRNVATTLRLMGATLGSEWIEAVEFEEDDAAFAEIRPTTWDKLQECGLVRATSAIPRRCQLTGRGWIAALKATGDWETKNLEDKAGRLSAELKRHVDGRREAEHTTIDEVVAATGLEENWIRNAIDSHLLREKFGQYDAGWDPEDQLYNYILIPRAFGHKL